jgi:hypothetical protein
LGTSSGLPLPIHHANGRRTSDSVNPNVRRASDIVLVQSAPVAVSPKRRASDVMAVSMAAAEQWATPRPFRKPADSTAVIVSCFDNHLSSLFILCMMLGCRWHVG